MFHTNGLKAVDFNLTLRELLDALTSCGLEVGALEKIQSVKGG